MNSLNKNFLIGAVIILSLISGAACSASSTQNTDAVTQKIEAKTLLDAAGGEFPRLSEDPNTVPKSEGEAPAAENAPAGQNEAALLVGVWRYQFVTNGYQCVGEDVYQPNGVYSSQWNCSGSILWHTGRWFLVQPGVIRRNLSDYEPKQFRGVPIRMVSAETVYYRFLDRNRLGMAGNIIAFRVQ
jgi:hypothetical protein